MRDEAIGTDRGSYLQVNQANWDSRADAHIDHYGVDRLLADPHAVSEVVAFDQERLGDITGLDAVHLQCHIGTDTLSLHRLGARMSGVDLSGQSLHHARHLAAQAGAAIDYVQSDVYNAPEALGGRTFDLVYTGIGALCWLPDIRRWARTVAALLRPGGRLFVRDGHPLLNSLIVQEVGKDAPERAQQEFITPAGSSTPALELSYFEQESPVAWVEDHTYAGDELISSPLSLEWNHGIGEIVTAVLEAGLTLTGLWEHDSVPWEALPGLMDLDAATGEYRLRDRPERLAASFTLTATRP